MNNKFRKFLFHLQLWDGIWSIFLGGLLFIICGASIQHFFASPDDPGAAPGFYDPSFLQAAIYASFIQVCINTAMTLGLYLSFRGLFRYIYGKKKEREVINQSKADLEALKPIQRLVFVSTVYILLVIEWIYLFKTLV